VSQSGGIKRDFARSFGQGRISAYLANLMGILSLAGVLCFRFPSYLTTAEFRPVYPVPVLRTVLLTCLAVSFLLALLSFLLGGRERAALSGLGCSALALALGGPAVPAGAVHEALFPVGLDFLVLDLLLLAVIFIPLEALFPQRVDQPTLHEEWKTDMLYFVVGHLLVQVIGALTRAPATMLFADLGLGGLQAHVRALPAPLQLVLAIFATDLVQYASHRAFHRVPALWRIHSVHHSTQAMDWLAGSRLHLVDILVTRALSFVPVYVLGVSPPVFAAYIVFVAFHPVLIHANLRWSFGPLRYVITTPRYHHWHHADEPAAYNTNFAVYLPLIDALFGTLYLPGDRWPERYGVSEPGYPKGYFAQLVWPFRSRT
jgi:sterol desaturase/sphingolipid hydroxylase (fatty acid hydroxylase superfamily)